MVTLKEIERLKAESIYLSPVTGQQHDSGSWVYDMTEEEWEKYKQQRLCGSTERRSRPC